MEALRRNYFELFSLPASFALDPPALESAWRALQGAVHPDRHAGAPESQRRLAMQLAAHVNEAVRTLRDPCRRAEYLCALNGVSVEAESNTSMPAAFLMQQMDWRERLEEARDAGDEVGLQALRVELGNERERLLEGLADAIDRRGEFVAAAGLVRQLMFVERFGQGIDSMDS
ncbi:Fe-S protein assembly co-chaperone HscB [Burkholderiaceae bacterium FT117]|uniref:Fe-S protein assembly co-chaperone HscB n=1 Tax=Zeimonas sediminis TaxID=2944268 RepID=UPI002343176F|nr:Fe-S protein assembly co-chaperone HscB [Zeimonas sediminis]MCM5568902.1 Fe-S protein assembly co-chaperone HscB [Zeimonas sediminis]